MQSPPGAPRKGAPFADDNFFILFNYTISSRFLALIYLGTHDVLGARFPLVELGLVKTGRRSTRSVLTGNGNRSPVNSGR